MNTDDDKGLALQLNKGDENAFRCIFEKYYQPLCLFSSHIMGDEELAEETVQDIFVKIWEKRSNIIIDTSLKHYLFRSVRNHCYNQLQHQKIKQQHTKYVIENAQNDINVDNFYIEPDLKNKIEEAVGSLPAKRQEIFKLSREEGLKYKEIAEKMNISVKTVEAQMGLALKYLREKLKDYNEYFNILFFLFKPGIKNKGKIHL